VKNWIYITAVALHLALAQTAFILAGIANSVMRACGSEWTQTVPCDNIYAGWYDKFMALAWLVGAGLVAYFAFVLKLNRWSKSVGLLFGLSAFNQFADSWIFNTWVLYTAEILVLITYMIFLTLQFKLWKIIGPK